MKKQMISCTIDGWTSKANESYSACTCHWIDEDFQLMSMILGCFPHSGKAAAPDHLRELKNQLAKFDIELKDIVNITTDTEPAMIATGRLIIEESSVNHGNTTWGGCIDHILELTTGIAFDDTPLSEGVMKKCRSLVAKFTGSSQALAKLIGVQAGATWPDNSPRQALTVIQDVVTRWWSTFWMCHRLLYLRQYLTLLVIQGHLTAAENLTDNEWMIVKDVTTLLQPFMTAQKVLEGEKYVTISLVLHIITTIRKGLEEVITNDDSSEHVKHLADKLLTDFNKHWGKGEAGTIVKEHEKEGPRRRPKGIPLHALIATFLDPRTKHCKALDQVNKELLRAEVKRRMIAMLPVETDGVALPVAAVVTGAQTRAHGPAARKMQD